MPLPITRRSLIALSVRAGAAVSLGLLSDGLATRPAHAMHRACGHAAGARGGPHPDPRPGVDASRMPPPGAVRNHPDAVAAFDEARQIPGVLDGIRCQCGCSDAPDIRSLLSCFEGEDAMALHCDVCEGQARLAYRLHRKGKSLDQVRAAIDARYGS
jgi:hypothetical protein